MRWLLMLTDRIAALFLGAAAGVVIGYSFAPRSAPTPVVVTGTMPASPHPPAEAALAGPVPIEVTMPIKRQLLETVAQGRKVRVGVFGDSFGDGIWSALDQLLPGARGYEVIKYSRQLTGFTRYASLNIEEHTAGQLAAGPVDIAVIIYGANDTQGVLADGHYAALLTDPWKRVIGERIEGMVDLLRSRGTMVYWVGLPKMRLPAFDDAVQALDGFLQGKMARLGVPFIEIAPLTVDDTGAYSAYQPDGPDHKRTLIRENDGIHMSMAGYIRVSREVAWRIDRYVAAARKEAAAGMRVAAQEQPSASLPPPAPLADKTREAAKGR